ncbi:serine hydrolase [Myxococcota bacterium]|nr:serine hydrolase [Myxococcota bacterium]
MIGSDKEENELPEINMPEIDRAIQTGIYEKTFSAAACIASRGGKVFHRAAYGSPTMPPPMRKIGLDTVFDLASLTKPLASGLAVLSLTGKNRLDIGTTLDRTLPEFKNIEKFKNISIDMLLDHTSGLPSYRSFWDDLRNADRRLATHQKRIGKAEAIKFFKERILETPLEYEPGSQEVYSDLGFMILGWIIENAVSMPLDTWLERNIYKPMGLEDDLFFIRLEDKRRQQFLKRRTFAATEDCKWRKKVVQGEVHDPNAWGMGGVAGHAGLFGTVDGVWKLTNSLWASYKGESRDFHGGTVRRFWTRSKRLRNTTRALVWDTPSKLEPSSGLRFSRNSIGHLGFTGCSIWIDLSTDIMGVVLTNSVHPSPDDKKDAMLKFRGRVYDLISKAGESLPPDDDRATGSAAFSQTTMAGVGLPLGGIMRGPGRR